METGFAQESAVEYIIMLAGQSASNAKCQGILVRKMRRNFRRPGI
ncbi:hypothetical protein glysoja_022125 [Glycine soja]|nr:hypothetical protein glysoja_022125 [Glycine soja]